METGSSAEVIDGVMASVDGRIRRDDDYIEGVLFSDGSTRAELDECAVSLGLDPGDYEDKFHLRRALSAKLTQQSIDDRLAAATPHSEGTVPSATSSEYQVPQALASGPLETGTTFSSLTVERVSEILRTFPRLLRDAEGAAQLFMTTSEATRVPFLEAILRGEDSDVVFAVSRSLGVNLSALASSGAPLAAIPAPTSTAAPSVASPQSKQVLRLICTVPPTPMQDTFEQLPLESSSLYRWALDGLTIAGVRVYGTDLRAVIDEAIHRVLTKAVDSRKEVELPPFDPDAMRDSILSGRADPDDERLPIVQAARRYILEQDNANVAAMSAKARASTTPAAKILRSALRDAETDLKESLGVPGCSTAKVLEFLHKYHPREVEMDEQEALREELHFGTLKIQDNITAFHRWNDARVALIQKVQKFIPNTRLEYGKFALVLNALPLDVKNQVQALSDADQIANRKLTTDELMDRVKRLFEMREQKRKETWRQNQHDGPTASPAAARSTASAHGGSAAQHASRGNSMPTSPLANRRASAAAVTSHASPVAGVDGIKQTTADTCASCKQPGHRVDVCPTVVYVPGSNGEVKKWADCYNCGAFGHVRSFCPKARSGYWVSYRSPGDDQAKNGMLLTDGPSMGGSGL